MNTSYPYEVHITPFYWKGGIFRVKVEPGNWYEVEGGNPAVDFNGFKNYVMPILRTPKIETRKLELNMISEKHQDKDKVIRNNAHGDEKYIQITDKIR